MVTENTDEEAEMMARFVQTRDRKIYEVLFRRYRGRMVAYASRYVSAPSLAEELAQEVFVRVYTTKRFEANASFKTWLYRVATNVCLNELRKGEHRQKLESIDGDEQSAPAAPAGDSPEAREETRRMSQALTAALGALPENQRAAFIMARMEGLSHAEIAAALSLSVPAVKSAIHRALEALRAEVQRLTDARPQGAEAVL